MGRWRGSRGLALGLLALMGGAWAAQPPDDLSRFLATYECSASLVIAQIHAHAHPEGMHRYIILNATGRRSSYVQCLFFDRDRQMLCEAASGWWAAPKDRPRFDPGEKQALAALGFSMDDSHGNFQRSLHFRAGPDPVAIAQLMLTALYRGYGARAGDDIQVQAPFAEPDGLLARKRCASTS